MDLPQLTVWCTKRQGTVEALVKLADTLDVQHSNVNKGCIVGSSAAICGAGLAVGSAILAPVTGGLSMVPSIVGAGVGITGTVTSLGAKFVESTLAKKALKDTQTFIEDDRKSFLEIEKMITTISDVEHSVVKYLESLVDKKLTNAPTSEPKPQKHEDMKKDLHKMEIKENESSKGVVTQIAAMNAPQVLVKGYQIARQTNLLNINRLLNIGRKMIPRQAIKDGACKLGPALNAGRVVRLGGVFLTVGMLPVDIYELVTTLRDLHEGKGHTMSGEIRKKADQLKEEMMEVQDRLMSALTELNNLVLLIRAIKKNGCHKNLDSILNQILKKLLPTKDFVKAFNALEEQTEESGMAETVGTKELSGILINCDGIKDSMYKELAMVLWSAWKVGKKSVVFLQNTNLVADPVLWTLFGMSVNSFGNESERGVSILFPLDFLGDIESFNEFKDNSDKAADWNGRCIMVSVNMLGEKYTFANILAPEGSTDRELFLKEAGAFVRSHTDGKLIIASNFRTEIKTMTVVVRNCVSTDVPLSLIEKFIPYQNVCEYLFYKPYKMNGPIELVRNVCSEYMLPGNGSINIDWSKCLKPMLSDEDYSAQIQPVLNLAVTDLWHKRNSGTLEFSTEKEIGSRVITCCQNLDFFISSEMEEEISKCKIEHTLRFLGFLKQSVMLFHRKEGCA